MTDTQQPDPSPGAYYVTAVDGSKWIPMLGPFLNDHAGALARVDDVRREAERLDPRAVWWSFGTAKMSLDLIAHPAGRLNDRLGFVPPHAVNAYTTTQEG